MHNYSLTFIKLFCTPSLSVSINSQITLGICCLSLLAAVFHEFSIFQAVFVHVVALHQMLSQTGCHDGTTSHRAWLLHSFTVKKHKLSNYTWSMSFECYFS